MKTEEVFESEVLVIGAGLIGSSVAMNLARLGLTDVRVIDFDLEGSLSSSELNAGAVRATWAQPLNVLISKQTIEYFALHAEEVGYRPCGYLWLHEAKKLEAAIRIREKQLELGWPVEIWDVAKLRTQIPFIDKTDDLAGAVFAPRDGLVNPNRLKNHFRDEAKKLGVRFHDRLWVKSAEAGVGARSNLQAFRFPLELTREAKENIYAGELATAAEKTVTFRANRIVNCAGAWASVVSKALGYSSPSVPVRRQVCIFESRDVDLTQYGMIVDSSGVYFHPEATSGLAGFANVGEPSGVNFSYDQDSFFMEQIWPALYERSSAFERLKHVTGWAGLYEVSPDESAIVGPVDGTSDRIWEAHSFSGRGVMQSYAAGRGLAERMVHGRYETLDLEELSGDRFAKGRSLRESLVI